MLKKVGFWVVAVCAFSTMSYVENTHATAISDGNEIHNVQEIQSVAISDELTLDIYVPKGAGEVGQRYTTMYVMDGQHYIHNAIGYQKSLSHRSKVSPHFIVVGINTLKLSDRPDHRWDLLGPNADKLISILEKQIIPYVDEHYPTNKRRMYYGWEAAAGFGLELFSKRPKLIEGYFLASSPTFTEKRLARTAKLLQKSKALNNYFYLSLGKKEFYGIESFQTLDKLFQQYSGAGFNWHYNFSDKFDHFTTPLDSFTNGLAWYFSDYPELTFYSLDEISQFGGVSGVIAYYENRAKRYQLSPEVGKNTQFTMFRHAADGNDWPLFQTFEQALGEFSITAESSPFWYDLFGRFYQKNGAFEKARTLYKKGVTEYPTSHALWAELAQTYEKLGKLTLALTGYRKALDNAKEQKQDYSQYEKQVQLLNERLTQ